MKIERDLQPDEPRIVYGIKGVKSKPFTRRFPNERAMWRWLNRHEDDITIHEIRRDD